MLYRLARLRASGAHRQRVNVIGKLTWDEVDLGKRELRVAGDRMKMEELVVVRYPMKRSGS